MMARSILKVRFAESFRGVANNGLLLAFFSGISITFSSLLAKVYTGPTYSQIIFYRSILIGCYMFAWCSAEGVRLREWLTNLPMRTLGWLFVQSLASFVAYFLSRAAYRHIPIGDAAAIFGATPVFTGIIGVVLIGEAWQLKHAYLSLLAWSGIALIYKPQFLFDMIPLGDPVNARTDIHHSQATNQNNLYWGGALLVPILASLSFIISRKLLHLPPQLIAFMKNSGYVIYSFVFMVSTGSLWIPTVTDIKYLVPDAVLGIITQSLLGLALQREKAAPVTLMRNSNILASFILQFAIYGTVPGWSSLAGAGLIILSTALLAIPDFRSKRMKLKET